MRLRVRRPVQSAHDEAQALVREMGERLLPESYEKQRIEPLHDAIAPFWPGITERRVRALAHREARRIDADELEALRRAREAVCRAQARKAARRQVHRLRVVMAREGVALTKEQAAVLNRCAHELLSEEIAA